MTDTLKELESVLANLEHLPAMHGSLPKEARLRWKDQVSKSYDALNLLRKIISRHENQSEILVLAEYTFADFKYGRVRIDFRGCSIREIHQLCALCKALEPERDTPAYTFGESYFCDGGHWYQGAPHNLIGNKFDVARVAQIKLPATKAESVDDLLKVSVAEQLNEKSGYWYSCSGCHESGECGENTGNYPYSDTFRCHPGSGCHECGGIGVLWDDTDYSIIIGDNNLVEAKQS